MTDRVQLLLEGLAVLHAEAAALRSEGPVLKLYIRRESHRMSRATDLISCRLSHRAREYSLRLPKRQLWFAYELGLRQSRRNASDIARSIQSDRFYAVTGTTCRKPWRMARTSVRPNVYRLRKALDTAFREARLGLRAVHVLRSAGTTGKEVQYWLKARVEIVELKGTEGSKE
jgi:hypothetical protein